jgi:hypothetical protein
MRLCAPGAPYFTLQNAVIALAVGIQIRGTQD